MKYPKWYYHRGGVSDKNFIMVRMRHIPPELQQEVSGRYESLYLKNGHIDVKEGRKLANEYLHKTARAYQGNNIHNGKVTQEPKPERPGSGTKKSSKMPSKYDGYILREGER